MTAWLASPRLAEAILGVLVLEALALLLYWRARGRGIAPAGYIWNLAAGAFFLLALRAALAGQDTWVAPFLAGAGLAHLADMIRRWKAG